MASKNKGKQSIKTDTDSQISEQIDKIRDVDAETEKPKLETGSTDDKKKHKTKASMAKPKAPPSESHHILKPFNDTTMSGKRQDTISTFVPSAYMMYYTVHLMDDTIRKNSYFKKLQDAWHPFISRIYFGILFYVQTLRAQLSMDTIDFTSRNFLKKFLSDYPPERLPVPGPLVTLFECLAPARPGSTLRTYVTPAIPENIGPREASLLIDYHAENTGALILPNIPMLIGFANLITNAQANAIPDFTVRESFNDTIDRSLNGSVFTATHWTEQQRAALLLPGMLYPPETDRAIDTSFNVYGKRLNLPLIVGTTRTRDVPSYLQLKTDNNWFGEILPIMSSYCEFFTDSRSLAECRISDTSSPLITTEYRKNSVKTDPFITESLNYAFPTFTCVSLEAMHHTTETNIAPGSAMIAQSSQLNVKITAENVQLWHHIGQIEYTRFGPYWHISPEKRHSTSESSYKSKSAIITSVYALSKPTNK